MEVLSYTCDLDLLFAILCITKHYNIAEVIGSTKYKEDFYMSKEKLIFLPFRCLWCGV